MTIQDFVISTSKIYLMNKFNLTVVALIVFFLSSFSNMMMSQDCSNLESFIDKKTGQIIHTITIGNQTWMANNLMDKNGFCNYPNKNDCQKYGSLFNFNSAIKACPEGWELPTKGDWEVLISNLGGETAAGKELKAKGHLETGDGYWKAYKEFEGTNSTCFGAQPGGFIQSGGKFLNIGTYGYFWTSSSINEVKAHVATMVYFEDFIKLNQYAKENFYSVRCIKK